MRKFYFSTLIFIFLAGSEGIAQEFSNKGREFWLAYSYHVGMVNTGGNPVMTLYITSDVNTTYSVEIYGVTTIGTGTIAPGQVRTVVIPVNYFINNDGLFSNRAIRVTAEKPVVVYSYITRNAASGATLCLPTSVLGREYISMNYRQISNESNSNSFLTIVAVEDNTNVEITPTGNTKGGWVANSTYTISLNKGQIYQVLGTAGTTTGVDLTGTTIRSVASAGGGCKKIAVFSGSGKISIGCPSPESSDNLYQQLYPIATWGKKYLTVPSYSRPNNIFRIAKSSAAANVYVNGVLISPASFTNNVYEFSNNIPNRIESDLPICVAQYFTTQACFGNSGAYDPDMIILNPVEQNIDKVTLVSSNLVATQNRQHHLHVIIKRSDEALNSFKLDGTAVAASRWITHPADPSYAYIYFSNVSQGYHTLVSDSGFNALAYGYADFESYGYSAGSNIKDLDRFISVDNQFAAVDFPATCRNAPFSLAMTFPYQPTQIIWQFGGLFPDVTIDDPAFDESSIVNGKQLYKYKLPGTYTAPAAGTYPIKIVVQNPTADGCSGVQEVEYDLQVFDPPAAGFNFTTTGCSSSPVNFTDNTTNPSGRAIVQRHWDFGDGNTQDDVASVSHTYTGSGPYEVKYNVVTDIGCKSGDATNTVSFSEPPIAGFTVAAPYCAGKAIVFKDASTITGSGSIVKWIWDFGDGSPIITAASGADQSHTYAGTGPYTATLRVETSSGCLSPVFTPSTPITIHPNPVVGFTLPSVCIAEGPAQFSSTSTISDGTESLFTYDWNFGDGSPAGSGSSPSHTYTSSGPFTVGLTVTSNNGCTAFLPQSLATLYGEPKADFNPPAEVCKGSSMTFNDLSTAPGSTVTQWHWDFGDMTTSADKNPVKTYAEAGDYTVTLKVTSAEGCHSISAANIATRQVVVNAVPVAAFSTDGPACEKQSVTFINESTVSAGNIVKWNWSYGDGNTAVLTTTGPVTHNYAAAGNYPVTLQVETDKGCNSDVTPGSITVNPLPSPAFTAPAICVSDQAAPFAGTADITSGSVIGWEWNFGDANASVSNPNIVAGQNSSHHFTLPQEYTVRLTATSDAGCIGFVEHPFIVNGAVLTPLFTVENTGVLCSNKEITIKDASQVDAGKIVRVEIFWDEDDLSIKTVDTDPAPGKTYAHTYPEFGSPASRSYNIRCDIYSGITCIESFPLQITLLATPSLEFNAINPVCSNEPAFDLNAYAQLLNGLPGSGTFSGPGVSPAGQFNPGTAGNGLQELTYTYEADNGCVNTLQRTVEVNPAPVADAGPDKFVLEGGVAMLEPVLVTDIPVSYTWSPSNWLNNPNVSNASTSPLTDFTYKLTVTSDKGCFDTDEVFVKLLKTPVIPNIFSPNGDGIHDRWVIQSLESYPGCVVQIYNRYGQAIYKIVNYTTPWDGKVNGKDVPVGTYYYIIDPKNGRKPITGYVDIIR